ncbi:group III truncated hemoglobin [Tamlana sp. 62-3]|uniref:Group III truncated hemoglobin n=1 Tax=Neotamlana sargassicola TaxID=2883125 RepID=A0A9X1I5V0_9FLAO|nr:group III truncated hemoglobin [Tamlana sargassicola]MCB4808406.1 group III truncated hemoglobin [Tamlana sargassicola]
MKKADLQTRADVYLLVSSFYEKVKNDAVLAPFFEGVENWDLHLENLTSFWESSLFLKTKYYGDPLEQHIKVDQQNSNLITQEHFGLWLNLWLETVNELFEGEYAEIAKNRARKMSTFLYLKIFEARME